MATRSEVFKAKAARAANPPKPKRKAVKRRDTPVDTAKPGVSATKRKAGGGSTLARNKSARAEAKGGAAAEDSATGKPSRKSTRKSTGRAKRTANLERRAVRKASAPKARAAKAKAKPKAKPKRRATK